jgi:WS/DGAT/MGAT family acyltransferase
MPPNSESQPLSPEDLTFWYADQPRQRTTMALLMLLDRAPDPERLRGAAARAVEAVPRLRQRVVEAPLGIALPRWEDDPTFDLDYHVRRYSLAGDTGEQTDLEGLFHTIGPIYERPFDRTRPLWELIEIDHPHGSAVFFRLHHAVADGVGGNTILAALTDADREGEPLPPPSDKPPGGWDEPPVTERLATAVRDRLTQDAERGRALAGAAWRTIREPGALAQAAEAVGGLLEDVAYRSPSPLTASGRGRRLSGVEIDFEQLRQTRKVLKGRMIDVLLTGVASAMGEWHRQQGHGKVKELLTLVPINLRPPELQGVDAGVGNRATGILVRLPIGRRRPIPRFREVRKRVEARKRNASSDLLPELAGAMAALPAGLYRRLAYASSQQIDLIVTNVPGIPIPRYVAGAEITSAYPYAPVAPQCPISVALYGYRGRLFVGIDADATAVPDLDPFRDMLERSFRELVDSALGKAAGHADD